MSKIDVEIFDTQERPKLSEVTERDWEDFAGKYDVMSTSPQKYYAFIDKTLSYHETQLKKVLDQFKKEIEMNTREESKGVWAGDKSLNSINAGSLQRIADATEKMAGNYTRLQEDVKYWKERAESAQKYAATLGRSKSALKGVITKLKNKLERP